MTFEQLDRSIDADSDSEDEMAEKAHAYRSELSFSHAQLSKTRVLIDISSVAQIKGKEAATSPTSTSPTSPSFPSAPPHPTDGMASLSVSSPPPRTSSTTRPTPLPPPSRATKPGVLSSSEFKMKP